MDASRILTFAVLLGAVLTFSAAVTTESEMASSATTEEMEEPTMITTSTRAPARNCSTARGVAGVCSMRQDCDHSTGPIDHSLYAPRWYKSSCLDGEVCCPFSALVPEQPRNNENEDDNSFFDN